MRILSPVQKGMDEATAAGARPNLPSQFNFKVDRSLQSWTCFEVQKGGVISSEKTHFILNPFIKKQKLLSSALLLLKHLFIAHLVQR